MNILVGTHLPVPVGFDWLQTAVRGFYSTHPGQGFTCPGFWVILCGERGVCSMAERIRVGDRLPFFLYDTPYSAGNRFRDLLDAQAPLVLVFMANFGHPITRTFASRYADTYTSLHDGGFALVVRSRADKLARSIGPDTLPYPLLCDAAGVLYEHLSSPRAKAR